MSDHEENMERAAELGRLRATVGSGLDRARRAFRSAVFLGDCAELGGDIHGANMAEEIAGDIVGIYTSLGGSRTDLADVATEARSAARRAK